MMPYSELVPLRVHFRGSVLFMHTPKKNATGRYSCRIDVKLPEDLAPLGYQLYPLYIPDHLLYSLDGLCNGSIIEVECRLLRPFSLRGYRNGLIHDYMRLWAVGPIVVVETSEVTGIPMSVAGLDLPEVGFERSSSA